MEEEQFSQDEKEFGESEDSRDSRDSQDSEDFEEPEDAEVNFEEIPAYAHLPPLDPWRKVRRELIKAVNLSRQEEAVGLETVYIDWLATEGCHDYTKLVLEDEEDEDQLLKMLSDSKAVGEMKVCTALTLLEEDVSEPKHLVEPFLDAHGLLMELNREMILDEGNTHVGIGLGVRDMRLCLVYAFSSKKVEVTAIQKAEGCIEVKGEVTASEFGVYVGRLVDSSMKEIAIVGPSEMSYEPNSKEFTIKIPSNTEIEYDDEGYGKNFLEVYIRANPDTIPYGKTSDSKVSIKHVELAERRRLEHYPDPRHQYEEAKIEERKALLEEQKRNYEEDLKKKEEEEAAKRQETREQQRKELMEQEKLRKVENEVPQSANTSHRQKDSSVEQQPSAPKSPEQESQQQSDDSLKSESEEEVFYGNQKQDLIDSILQNQEIQRSLKQENQEMEKRIVAIRRNLGNIQDKSSEDSMTMHKYLNTLANVHQVKQKMNELTETYENWAQVYQENIKEKQERCNEIQQYLKDFKKEVAKQAEYSRTGKPIPQRVVDSWEESESQRESELQQVRINNITLKSKLVKLENEGKTKEELAEGLHLIDYEQLKIEKQTLNDKIEERNEELHKLRKKIETTVQMLTHTKEKLKFITAEKKVLKERRDKKARKLETGRNQLNSLKKRLETIRADLQKHRQETGIVNSNQLDSDLAKRKKYVEDLKETLISYEKQFTQMQETIASAKALE